MGRRQKGPGLSGHRATAEPKTKKPRSHLSNGTGRPWHRPQGRPAPGGHGGHFPKQTASKEVSALGNATGLPEIEMAVQKAQASRMKLSGQRKLLSQ